jgi:hypothetical protein
MELKDPSLIKSSIQAKQVFWIVDIRHIIYLINGSRINVILFAVFKEATNRDVLEEYPVLEDSHVFFDAMVLLGTPNVNQTKTSVRLVGYIIEGKSYWVATDRFDISAEQVALIYKLRWDIESFFAWWKRHLKVYHLFARSKNGLMVQILSGLITYLLLAIYCHEQHREPVSIYRVRQLRNQIRNEAYQKSAPEKTVPQHQKRKTKRRKQLKKSHAIS